MNHMRKPDIYIYIYIFNDMEGKKNECMELYCNSKSKQKTTNK